MADAQVHAAPGGATARFAFPEIARKADEGKDHAEAGWYYRVLRLPPAERQADDGHRISGLAASRATRIADYEFANSTAGPRPAAQAQDQAQDQATPPAEKSRNVIEKSRYVKYPGSRPH